MRGHSPHQLPSTPPATLRLKDPKQSPHPALLPPGVARLCTPGASGRSPVWERGWPQSRALSCCAACAPPERAPRGPGESGQHFLLRAIEQRSPTSERAGSELIPVTRHSGTLTTNSIENRLAIKARNGKPPSLGGYLTNCLTDKYIKMILQLESLEVEVKLRKSNQNVN